MLGVSNNLLKLEKKLNSELDTILEHEEAMWFQKSHTEWIAYGDRSKYQVFILHGYYQKTTEQSDRLKNLEG